jgi:hypothetical protein
MDMTFSDDEWSEFRKQFVDERRTNDGKVSQVTFFVIGKKATDAQKTRFSEQNGKKIREGYEKYISEKFREAGIVLTVKVSGQSSIDITLPNIDKSFGLAIMGILFRTTLDKVMFTGDAFDMNDEAALKAVRVLGNVGPWIDATRSRFYRPGTRFYQLPEMGPSGFRQFARVITDTARTSEPAPSDTDFFSSIAAPLAAFWWSFGASAPLAAAAIVAVAATLTLQRTSAPGRVPLPLFRQSA